MEKEQFKCALLPIIDSYTARIGNRSVIEIKKEMMEIFILIIKNLFEIRQLRFDATTLKILFEGVIEKLELIMDRKRIPNKIKAMVRDEFYKTMINTLLKTNNGKSQSFELRIYLINSFFSPHL